MSAMKTSEKTELVKVEGMKAVALPEDAIQIGDYTYAIPVAVDGERRYAKLTMTSTNNKDTKTTRAFDPEDARDEWLADKQIKAEAKEQAAALKAKKDARKKSKSSGE